MRVPWHAIAELKHLVEALKISEEMMERFNMLLAGVFGRLFLLYQEEH